MNEESRLGAGAFLLKAITVYLLLVSVVAFVGYSATFLLQLAGYVMFFGTDITRGAKTVIALVGIPPLAMILMWIAHTYSWRALKDNRVTGAFWWSLFALSPLLISAFFVDKYNPYAPLFGLRVLADLFF
jgi:hypothetical protein